jgi:hypothetical protein
MVRSDHGAAAFRRACRASAVALLFAVTVSCVGPDADPNANPNATPSAGPNADRAGPPAAVTEDKVATRSARDATELVPDKPAKPSLPVPDSNPKRLVGMDHSGLIDLLGAPAFLRNDAPAQLWRYRHESCVLNLYLYSERGKPGVGFKVRHYDVRSRTSSEISARECFAALLKSHLAGNS